MTISFKKYHGAGNDFIIIDNRKKDLSLSTEQISLLCHRQFGIGADGLMLLEPHSNLDFHMRYFNSDGLEGTMCGNGGRCIAMFAFSNGIASNKTLFCGADGEHAAEIVNENTVRLKMQDVSEINTEDEHYIINTGSPHFVQFVADVDHVDVTYQGRLIRKSYLQNNGGVNANFAHFVADGIKLRTYERGVEDETLACGTGAVATAIAANHWFNEDKNTYVLFAKGGTLKVSFERVSESNYQNIWLEGPVAHVFDGSINLNR